GWYGFALHPNAGVVKIGRHGTGLDVDPVRDAREVHESDIAAMWSFVREAIPELADSELVYTRRCLYADTIDADYWLDHHPDHAGLTVASGGSGHGFKMAPIMGSLIANLIEGVTDDRLARFAWRTDKAAAKSEAARFDG
ncbi:MAG: FAD-dependent oxidoreductase, partial [Bacteroidota bacterium]|nr:FAD-dependent oxidoreductase [Bacteroidota bacterium]